MSKIRNWLLGLFRAPAPTFTERDLQRMQAAEAKRNRREEKRRNGHVNRTN